MPNCTFALSLLFNSSYFSVVFRQITQQVYMVKEWIRDARKEAEAEALSCADVEKSLGALKQEQAEMSKKLNLMDQARLSAEANLKTMERQAEHQCQKLHLTEIDLATERQLVRDLKAELQKTKETAQLAKEAAEAEKRASYLLGVEETKIRLAEEPSKVCWDYCDTTWDKALSTTGVPMNSVLRQPGSIYYHPYIRDVPDAVPSSTTIASDTSEQPLAIQVALPPPEVSKGSNQVGDQNQGVEGDKDKDKGKKKLPSLEAKSAAEDAAAKTKEAKAQTKKANPKAKDASTSQPSQKEDPPAPKSKT